MNHNDETTAAKAHIETTFNLVADVYDSPEMRYFPYAGDYMINLVKPRRGEKVLDIAAGTGMVSIPAARAVGPDGQVQAIDLAEGMLDKAKKNINKHALTNIDLHVMDAENLEFRSNYFDLITCGFGVFFLPDPYVAINNWARVLKPGGQIIFTTFNNSAFMPMAKLFKEAYEETGCEYPKTAWQQFSEDELCLALLDDALYENKKVTHKQHGVYLNNEHEWWHIIESSGFRGILANLNDFQQLELRNKHLQQVAELKTEEGIWLDVEVIFTQAMRK
ncbi:MAG: class I SAM-dependent methyltransferase [Thioalkalispiraceae bacterium]|jgi:ubiquinone/menaquinone biosynthesis C-methylase UbiE